jgi:hypothetical protein
LLTWEGPGIAKGSPIEFITYGSWNVNAAQDLQFHRMILHFYYRSFKEEYNYFFAWKRSG